MSLAPTAQRQSQRAFHTPSSLNRLLRSVLEDVFPLIEVEGEIGSFKPAASGHWYFVLKDAGAEVRVSMFRNRSQLVRLRPANGDKVLVRGRISLYEARGDCQLIADWLEPAGFGDKLLALNRLKQQLAAEGLFAPERKRVLPAWPHSLLVLTSRQGAALHDVLSVLRRRFPLLPVTLLPVQVQGDGAALQLTGALHVVAKLPPALQPAIVLLTRGGGSQEDLWCFNDEALARQVAAMPMPVVAAIGHEVDLTLVELVADLRAATPSAAAELLSPDGAALRQRIAQGRQRLDRTWRYAAERREMLLEQRLARLQRQHPAQRLALVRERLSGLAGCLRRNPALAIERLRQRSELLSRRLHAVHPVLWLTQQEDRLASLLTRLSQLSRMQLERRRQLLLGLQRTLYATSPQATLDRGYALVFDGAAGSLLSSATQAHAGQTLRVRLTDGHLRVTVDAARSDD